ncbi:hypothetical protein BDV95DRAFT_667772 [Massariosphaeria phaeospora]|uniref:Uncharacterized protein n=1 Tax=Massariosphaeria phaeospora TaxID=100035 RepID=A0A7C8M8G3_9PLEO|nr:hypothetical protein BDV95DRAFT_667772 [Massariosphaeria phaeospora]
MAIAQRELQGPAAQATRMCVCVCAVRSTEGSSAGCRRGREPGRGVVVRCGPCGCCCGRVPKALATPAASGQLPSGRASPSALWLAIIGVPECRRRRALHAFRNGRRGGQGVRDCVRTGTCGHGSHLSLALSAANANRAARRELNSELHAARHAQAPKGVGERADHHPRDRWLAAAAVSVGGRRHGSAAAAVINRCLTAGRQRPTQRDQLLGPLAPGAREEAADADAADSRHSGWTRRLQFPLIHDAGAIRSRSLKDGQRWLVAASLCRPWRRDHRPGIVRVPSRACLRTLTCRRRPCPKQTGAGPDGGGVDAQTKQAKQAKQTKQTTHSSGAGGAAATNAASAVPNGNRQRVSGQPAGAVGGAVVRQAGDAPCFAEAKTPRPPPPPLLLLSSAASSVCSLSSSAERRLLRRLARHRQARGRVVGRDAPRVTPTAAADWKHSAGRGNEQDSRADRTASESETDSPRVFRRFIGRTPTRRGRLIADGHASRIGGRWVAVIGSRGSEVGRQHMLATRSTTWRRPLRPHPVSTPALALMTTQFSHTSHKSAARDQTATGPWRSDAAQRSLSFRDAAESTPSVDQCADNACSMSLNFGQYCLRREPHPHQRARLLPHPTPPWPLWCPTHRPVPGTTPWPARNAAGPAEREPGMQSPIPGHEYIVQVSIHQAEAPPITEVPRRLHRCSRELWRLHVVWHSCQSSVVYSNTLSACGGSPSYRRGSLGAMHVFCLQLPLSSLCA